MKFSLKQLVVAVLLGFLRFLISVKRHFGPILRRVLSPFVGIGRFLLRFVAVPLYRLLFALRRLTSHLIRPAKNRLVYLASNRYVLHLSIFTVAIMALWLSPSSSGLRAESFGSTSILYAIVAQDVSQQIDVVSSGTSAEHRLVSYLGGISDIDPADHIDLNYIGEDYVTPTVGGVEIPKAATPLRSEIVTHVVADGETLSGIASTYGLSLSTLLWANNLSIRSALHIGDKLTVLPADGVVHTVKKGDTLSKIAGLYSAKGDDIVAFNHLGSADDLKIGEQLLVPGGEKPAPVPARTAPIAKLIAGKPSEIRGKTTGNGTWVWPTDWRVITQYFGWKHTGIDVDGDYTTRSYAAADGVVVYAGWRNGYGSTVEIDHSNGIMTRYGHHSKLYVKKGDMVKAGDLLAQTGTTGRSTGTHLHFEVIKNGKFQNPLDWVR